MQKKQEQAI